MFWFWKWDRETARKKNSGMGQCQRAGSQLQPPVVSVHRCFWAFGLGTPSFLSYLIFGPPRRALLDIYAKANRPESRQPLGVDYVLRYHAGRRFGQEPARAGR